MKKKTPEAARPASAGKIRLVRKQSNPNLDVQTRKVLAKHYRAKYGVK